MVVFGSWILKAYLLLTFAFLSNGGSVGSLLKAIWKVKTHSKCAVFCWASCRDRILTLDNLRRWRNKQMLTNACFLCLRDEETSYHLLLSCSVGVQIWHQVVLWFNMCWVYAGSLIVHLSNLHFCQLREKGHILWRISWTATMWSLWLERNKRCFKNKKTPEGNLAQLIKWRCASWAAVLPEFKSYLVEDIFRNWWEVINDQQCFLSIRLVWQPPNFDGSALGASGCLVLVE